MSSPILGTVIHAIGGASAAACYTPFQGVRRWCWESFWLVQSVFAWLIVPLVIGWATVPQFFSILANAPSKAFWLAFVLGGIYGFGGMAFGYAIRNIGFSLTYTISISISAIIGMLAPPLFEGTLIEKFSQPGSLVIITGMVIALIGVAFCGRAGFHKEKDLAARAPGTANAGVATPKFNMARGLALACFAGVLSAVFGISLAIGQPIADMAAAAGAGHFQGNAKQIVSTGGCFVVNFIWFLTVSIRQKTLKELVSTDGISSLGLTSNFLFAALAGTLWAGQFFFYGIAHVHLDAAYQHISWALHMMMLIFFSYIVGIIMKEWKGVSKTTFRLMVAGLVILFLSFVTIGAGMKMGEPKKIESTAQHQSP